MVPIAISHILRYYSYHTSTLGVKWPIRILLPCKFILEPGVRQGLVNPRHVNTTQPVTTSWCQDSGLIQVFHVRTEPDGTPNIYSMRSGISPLVLAKLCWRPWIHLFRPQKIPTRHFPLLDSHFGSWRGSADAHLSGMYLIFCTAAWFYQGPFVGPYPKPQNARTKIMPINDIHYARWSPQPRLLHRSAKDQHEYKICICGQYSLLLPIQQGTRSPSSRVLLSRS